MDVDWDPLRDREGDVVKEGEAVLLADRHMVGNALRLLDGDVVCDTV